MGLSWLRAVGRRRGDNSEGPVRRVLTPRKSKLGRIATPEARRENADSNFAAPSPERMIVDRWKEKLGIPIYYAMDG